VTDAVLDVLALQFGDPLRLSAIGNARIAPRMPEAPFFDGHS